MLSYFTFVCAMDSIEIQLTDLNGTSIKHIGVGQSALIKVRITGSLDSSVSIPGLEHFYHEQRGSYKTMYSVNGKQTKTIDHEYFIRAQSTGIFKVGPVEIDGIKSNILIIRVKPYVARNRNSKDEVILECVPNIVYDILLSETFDGTMNLTLREVNLSANVNNSINLDKHKQESGYFVTYVINTDYSFDVSDVTFSYYGESYATEGNLQLWKCDSYDLEGRSCSGNWIDVTSSAIQNTDNNHFEYSTTSFSGFGIKEYVATVTPTGGGGGSCTYDENYDWQCGGWSFCVEGSQKTRFAQSRNKRIRYFSCRNLCCKSC